MKKLFYLTIFLAFFACKPGAKNTNAEARDTAIASEKIETTYNISGMHCDMCVASIRKGIGELEGVATVDVSLEDSSAVVSYDAAKLNGSDIEKAIEKRGYSVKK